MVIDGNSIAETLYGELKERVGKLHEKGVTPKLAIVLVGEDPASKTYIGQKEQKARNIGAQTELFQYPAQITTDVLLNKVRELNANQEIYGIIVQRPLPEQINPDVIQEAIDDRKDVDGFKPGSPFHVPLVMAVIRIVSTIVLLEKEETGVSSNEQDTVEWLKQKKLVLIGKGSTSGQPLVDYVKEKGIPYQLIDSKTSNSEEIIKSADIIISSVGKPHLIQPETLKKDVILISVGLSKDENGKIHGDYEEEEIQDIASYYTNTPGGVGPVNVAMLLYNLVTAAEQ